MTLKFSGFFNLFSLVQNSNFILCKIKIAESRVCFWKFRFFFLKLYFWTQYGFSVKNFSYDENFDFWRKFCFDESFHFWPKYRFSINISMLQNISKISLLTKNFDFWWIFRFLSKKMGISKLYIFSRKLDISQKKTLKFRCFFY